MFVDDFQDPNNTIMQNIMKTFHKAMKIRKYLRLSKNSLILSPVVGSLAPSPKPSVSLLLSLKFSTAPAFTSSVPQSSRSPSMAAVTAPEAEGAGAVPAGAAHARSRRAPPTSAPEAPAPTPGRRLRALTAAARRPARRGTAARSPGPPVNSEAAPRDSPRGGAAARRRGARSGERGQRRGAFPRHHGAARGPAAGRAGGRLRLRARLPALRRGLLHRVRPLPQVRARSCGDVSQESFCLLALCHAPLLWKLHPR